jgi:N-acetylmuramoyl-L-alanine amidase
MRILNDAGHGGKDSGAVSHDGKVFEKDVALTVAKRVHELLAPHGESHLSRGSDQFLTLSERAKLANNLKADLLSIHCNAGGGRGIEVFTSPGETLSDPWATCVLEELHADFPDRPLRTDVRDGDPDKEARFTVLTKTRKSAILVELGFIDTEEGQRFLSDPVNQERLAQAIARGTLRHHGLDRVAPKKVVSLTLEERVVRLEKLHPELV